MSNPFRRRSAADLSVPQKVVAFVLLCAWALVVLFPIYWLVVTSFKTPYDVDRGPSTSPSSTSSRRSTPGATSSSSGNDTATVRQHRDRRADQLIALLMGSFTAYALVRFTYRPKLGLIGVGIGCIAFAFIAAAIGAPVPIAIAAAVAIFVLLAQTIGAASGGRSPTATSPSG